MGGYWEARSKFLEDRLRRRWRVRHMTARQAREIRAGINSVRVPYKTGGCPKHGYFSSLDIGRLYEMQLESALFGGSRLYEKARGRTGYRTVVREVPCWECG